MGVNVTVLIPSIDRSKSDLPRLPCVVSRLCGHKQIFYELVCEHGILADCYRACDLDPYSGIVKVDLKKINEMKKVSLRVAAAAARLAQRGESASTEHAQADANRFKETNIVCHCNGPCFDNRRCNCFKSNKKCSSHCHKKSKKNCCRNF